MRASDLKAKACEFAARNLSETEWKLYLSGEAYRETCPGQPRLEKVGDLTSKVSTPSP